MRPCLRARVESERPVTQPPSDGLENSRGVECPEASLSRLSALSWDLDKARVLRQVVPDRVLPPWVGVAVVREVLTPRSAEYPDSHSERVHVRVISVAIDVAVRAKSTHLIGQSAQGTHRIGTKNASAHAHTN